MISLKKTVMILGLVFVVGLFVLPPAQAQTFVEKEEFDEWIEYPCAVGGSEWVNFEGTMHTVAHEQESESGNVHLKFQITIHASGVGIDTGDKYQLRKRFEFQVNDNDCPTVFSIEFVAMVAGQGPGNNGWIRLRLFFVEDGNCEFRTGIELLDGECSEEGNADGI